MARHCFFQDKPTPWGDWLDSDTDSDLAADSLQNILSRNTCITRKTGMLRMHINKGIYFTHVF